MTDRERRVEALIVWHRQRMAEMLHEVAELHREALRLLREAEKDAGVAPRP